MAEHLFQLAAVLLANLGCAILGGVIGSAQTRRALRAAVPASVGYHPDGPGEETVEVRTEHPESTAVAADLAVEPEPEPAPARTGMWPVHKTQRLDLLDGETVRIRVGRLGHDVRPWRWQGQHRGPESLAERPEPLFLADKPLETTEHPRLDWSSRTGELDEVSG
jgi:hypothetical protein